MRIILLVFILLLGINTVQAEDVFPDVPEQRTLVSSDERYILELANKDGAVSYQLFDQTEDLIKYEQSYDRMFGPRFTLLQNNGTVIFIDHLLVDNRDDFGLRVINKEGGIVREITKNKLGALVGAAAVQKHTPDSNAVEKFGIWLSDEPKLIDQEVIDLEIYNHRIQINLDEETTMTCRSQNVAEDQNMITKMKSWVSKVMCEFEITEPSHTTSLRDTH